VRLDRLRAYLTGNYASQSLSRRAWLLLASTRLPGLLTAEQRRALMTDLQGVQNEDGGWSLYKLGPWRYSKTDPPFAPGGKPDLALLAQSDGYATGLVAYVLHQAGSSCETSTMRRAIGWLKANQQEFEIDQHRWKSWRAHSLNADREHGGTAGEPWKRLVMSDLATGFATLALLSAD
jgi:hypothetical protein